MPVVASVRLRYVPKNYWFDPAGCDVHEGDHVLVETERGKEMGLCVGTGLEVSQRDLKAPLKPILRVATEEDYAKIDALDEDNRRAYLRFRELVEEHGLDMKPVSVEHAFEGDRAVFYFTADERVDFRSLVRDLASELRVRVDMRQIGVRDEARALGGLSHCGQELCCARMGGEFQPVSIRMAKEQDLPLNPSKISGLCGRLMCCLRYEFEAYKDFKSRSPKKNALIDTPAGMAKVVEFDTPRELVRVRFEDGKSMEIPLSSMDTGDKQPREGERLRPCHVSQEAFDKLIEELHQDTNLAMMGDKLFSKDPKLADQEAQAGSVERGGRRRRRRSSGDNPEGSKEGTARRRKSGSGRSGGQEPAPRTERRRRRSVSVADGEVTHVAAGTEGSRAGDAGGTDKAPHSARRRRRGGRGRSSQGGSSHNTETASAKDAASSQRAGARPRPGQHSSTVSGDASQHGARSDEESQQAHRRRRRRGKRGGRKRGDGNGAGGDNAAGSNSSTEG